jgi:hypothetical protein
MNPCAPPLDSVFIESVRLTGARRDGSPIERCNGLFHAYYVRRPRAGVAMTPGWLSEAAALSRAAAAPSSGGER